MRRIIGKIHKERPFCCFSIPNAVNRPVSEQIGGVSFWGDYLPVVAHAILSHAPMRPVVVHHVVNESVELVESAFTRMVFIFQPQVPLADMKRFISCPTQHIGQRDGIGGSK